jgi:hypothetical protein
MIAPCSEQSRAALRFWHPTPNRALEHRPPAALAGFRVASCRGGGSAGTLGTKECAVLY